MQKGLKLGRVGDKVKGGGKTEAKEWVFFPGVGKQPSKGGD